MEKLPRQIFVNHGEDTSATEFAETLKEKFGTSAMAPFSGTSYDLLRGEFDVVTEGVPVKKKEYTDEVFTKSRMSFSKLSKAMEKLRAVVNSAKGFSNKELERFALEVESLAEKYKIQ